MIGSFWDLLLAVEVVVVGVLVVEGLDATGAAGKILQAAGVPRSVLHNRNISLMHFSNSEGSKVVLVWVVTLQLGYFDVVESIGVRHSC